MNSRSLPAALATLLVLAAPLARAERVQIQAPDGTQLTAHWMPRPGAGTGPAIVALHGCGGLYGRDGKVFDSRYPDYVTRLNKAGFHVLLPDSFGSRGSGSICAVPGRQRGITVETRRGDAIAAVEWLAKHPDVDPRGILMLGWSHGATTTLSAINASRPFHAQPLAGAVVFYPGCAAALKESFRLRTPVLMLLGEKDDWTPPARCIELAERTLRSQPDADLAVHLYSDSYHGFDSTQPVRLRLDVRGGVSREGVHVGGNPAARAGALAEVDAFLAARLKSAMSAPPLASSPSRIH
ncbi:MAG: dienelactone hydrolase family protein [Burkholderiaceae bacterium]|jgi:dienelactone hydrolase|nr:dienelactone hydrolase family protein [Burkholderiaceae bacterium]